MTITEYLDHCLDKADAVYKSGDPTLARKVEELESVLGSIVLAVKLLDDGVDRVSLK